MDNLPIQFVNAFSNMNKMIRLQYKVLENSKTNERKNCLLKYILFKWCIF